MQYTRRSFLRRYGSAPIRIRHDGMRRSHRAQMSDCCIGGMQLISDQFIKPGAQITITPCDRMVGMHGDAQTEECTAEVVWCHRCEEGTNPRYVIGIRFVRLLDH